MANVLLKAVSAGRPRQVRLLLDSGISTETTDDCGQTPLIRSIFIEHSRNREKIARLLLRYGAVVSTADIVGRNSLSWACLYGRDTEVEILLENRDVNLDLNQVDINGQTALFHAVTSGNAACVKLIVDGLKKYDLSVDIANYNGVTPLMQAGKFGHDVCASILIHHGGASVGLGTEGVRDVTSSQKWATKSHRKKPKTNTSTPQFPPIIAQSVAQKIKYRENRANQYRQVSFVESDSDSTYGSEKSYTTETYETASETRREPQAGDVLDAHYKKTSSTEALADSEDDDVDDVSTPIKDKQGFTPTRDLPDLFHIYEEQYSPGYYPSAVQTRELSNSDISQDTSDSGTDVPPRSKTKLLDRPLNSSQTKQDLRKLIMRRQLTRKQLRDALQQILPTKFPNPPPQESSTSSSESDVNDSQLTNRITVLPMLPNDKKVCLVRPGSLTSDKQTHRSNNRKKTVRFQ